MSILPSIDPGQLKADIAGAYDHITSIIALLALLISAFFLFLAGLVIFRFRRNGKHKGGTFLSPSGKEAAAKVPVKLEKLTTTWLDIDRHAASFNESDWKLAVIEADKFTDAALRDSGFSGETMGEKLMLIKPGQILNLQDLWDAHKLRNLLVHDLNFKINQQQAAAAVKAFEKVLRQLGRL